MHIYFQFLWFVLIAVLFSVFFILEGFDYGVGMLHMVVGKNQAERDLLMRSVEPVWDGNEVWLLTAGGAMFASFPLWYASLFSGFYLLLFFVLVGLILRGVSFVFRHYSEGSRSKLVWDVVFSVANVLPPFFLGVIFIDWIQGVPMDANYNVLGGFSDFINPFSILGGVAVTLLCLLHGFNFLSLRTVGDLHERVKSYSKKLYLILLPALVVFAAALAYFTDFLGQSVGKTVAVLCILLLIVLLSVLAIYSVYKNKEGLAFIASSLTFPALVALLFVGIFPNVMLDSSEAAHHLAFTAASSSELTLTMMTVITICLLPFVLVYQAWTFYVFRRRLKVSK